MEGVVGGRGGVEVVVWGWEGGFQTTLLLSSCQFCSAFFPPHPAIFLHLGPIHACYR